MKGFSVLCFVIFTAYFHIVGGDLGPENSLSYYITTILNHYKQEDPIGAPIIPVPDPLEVPPLSHSIGPATMKCTNVSLTGLSKFRVDYAHVDLVEMQVQATIKIDTVNITGNYTLKSWLSKSTGNFTVGLVNVTIEAMSGLEVQENDQLEAKEINTDFFNDNITMDFTGLSPFERSMIGSSGSFVFESSKPYMMREMNAKLREDMNVQVKRIQQKFPKPVAPIDQLITKAREYASVNYEPLKLDDFVYATTISKVQLSHTWLYGVSNFRRLGDINLEIRNKTVVFKLDVGTENFNGSTQWEVSIMSGQRAGSLGFSLEDLRVEITVSQPMDTSKPPRLEDIHLTLGEIHVGFAGAGIYDLPVVVVANILPNMLNQQIIGCLEVILKTKLRQILTDVSLDEVILGNLSKLENLNKSGRFLEFLSQ